MDTSYKSRSFAHKILSDLVHKNDQNYFKTLELMMQHLGESLKNEEVSDQFFEFLKELLNKAKIEEIVRKNQEEEDRYIGIFSHLFTHITRKSEVLSYVQKKKERF